MTQNEKKIVFCPFKVNSNTIELIVHTPCCCVLDLLCLKMIDSASPIQFGYLIISMQCLFWLFRLLKLLWLEMKLVWKN